MNTGNVNERESSYVPPPPARTLKCEFYPATPYKNIVIVGKGLLVSLFPRNTELLSRELQGRQFMKPNVVQF